MGFSSTQSQLLSAPPYVLAAIMTYISGWLGDRYKIRGPLVAIHQLITAIGMLVTAYGQTNAARYFGAFLGKSMFPQYRIYFPRLIYILLLQGSASFNSASLAF